VHFRLRPRDTRLGPEFSRLCLCVVAAAGLLGECVGLQRGGDATLGSRIAEVDAEAEEAMHAVLSELASALVTPIDRADVFRLAASVRDCSRAIADVVDLVDLIGSITATEAIVEEVQYVQVAAEVTADAVPRFARKRMLTETWIELSRLRKQSAARYRVSLVDLTGPPRADGSRPADGPQLADGPRRALDPVAVARLLQVESGLQAVMRSFDLVGHALQLIVAKEG
jgi:hypothetical protein